MKSAALIAFITICFHGHCFAQELAEQKRELPAGPVASYFSIKNLVFGYEQSQMPEYDGTIIRALSLENSIIDGVPPASIRSLLAHFAYNDECSFQFDNASFGSKSWNCWYVWHALLPKNQNFAGMAYQYLTVVDKHGKVIDPRIALVSRSGKRQNEQIVSAFTIDGILNSPNQYPAIAEDDAKRIAQKIVESFLTHSNEVLFEQPAFRLGKTKKFEVVTNSNLKIVVWQCDFDRPNEKEPLALWVVTDKLHSSLTLNRWYFDEPRDARKSPNASNGN
jgi:hypothetical protein